MLTYQKLIKLLLSGRRGAPHERARQARDRRDQPVF